MDNEFICPECGSKDAYTGTCISKSQPTGKNRDPWADVLQQSECASCKMIIPDHLGDRWDNISIKEAQKEVSEIIEILEKEENLENSMEKYHRLIFLNKYIEQKFKDKLKNISKKNFSNTENSLSKN